MGYTHYLVQGRDATADEWAAICDTARAIVAAAAAVGIDLAGPDGEGGPVIDGERVALNGRGEPGGPMAYEAAIVTRSRDGDGWGFTKTGFENRPTRPYDAAVVALFVSAQGVAPDAYRWSSDGDDGELAAGMKLCEIAHRLCDLADDTAARAA